MNMLRTSWSVPLPVKRLVAFVRPSTPPLRNTTLPSLHSDPHRPSLRSRIKWKWVAFIIVSMIVQAGVLIHVFRGQLVYNTQVDFSHLWQPVDQSIYPASKQSTVYSSSFIDNIVNNDWIKQLNRRLRSFDGRSQINLVTPSVVWLSSLQEQSLNDTIQHITQQQSSCHLNQLVYKCDVERLEGDDELIDGHTLTGAESMLHAMTLAVASRRVLLIDTSSCNFVEAGDTHDGLAFCCHFHHLFEPLSNCSRHPQQGTIASYVHPFVEQVPVVLYQSDQQCIDQPRIWQNMVNQNITSGALTVSKAIARYMMRPNERLRNQIDHIYNAMMSSHTTANPAMTYAPSPVSELVDERSFLSTHISTRRAHGDDIIPRWQPVSAWFEPLRRLSTEQGIRHVFLSGASATETNELKIRMRHLQFSSLFELDNTLPRGVAQSRSLMWLQNRMIEVFMHARSEKHLGLLSSSMTRLSTMFGLYTSSTIDIEGGFWSPGCFLASHLYQPKPITSRIKYAYHPSLAQLTRPPTVQHDVVDYQPIKPPLQLIVVVGTSNSGLTELNNFLTVGLLMNRDVELSAAFSAMFAGTHYFKDRYLDNRDRLVALMCSLSDNHLNNPASPQRILIEHKRDHFQAEKSIAHFAQPSLLASIIDEFGLHIQLKVIAIVRDPDISLINLLLHQSLSPPSYVTFDEYPVYEAKIERDLTYQLNSELRALDTSIVRIFDFERLFQGPCGQSVFETIDMTNLMECQVEVFRLAQFIDLDVNVAWAKYFNWIRITDDATKQSINQRATRASRIDSISTHIKGLHALSIFDQIGNPAYRSPLYDERLTHHAAVLARRAESVEQSNPAVNMHDYIWRHQQLSEDECASRPLLVFDGYIHWLEANQSTEQSSSEVNQQQQYGSNAAARQIFHLIQTLSLALATGRTLVAPLISETILQFLEPLSSCSLQSAGLMLDQDNRLVPIGASQLDISNNSLSDVRVVVSHSHTIDFAFLASFTPGYQPMGHSDKPSVSHPNVGAKSFVAAMAHHIMRPTQSIRNFISHSSLGQRVLNETSMVLLVPSSIAVSVNTYESLVRSLISTYGIKRLTLSPTSALFQCEPDDTYVPQFLVDATNNPLNLDPSIYDPTSLTLTTQLIKQLSKNQPDAVIEFSNRQLGALGNHSSNSVIFKQFANLLQAATAKLVVGSQSSLDALLINTLFGTSCSQCNQTTNSHFYDIRGFHWLDSIIALNHVDRAHDHYDSVAYKVELPIQPIGQFVSRKTVFNPTVRFVYVVGTEGTGHHFLQSLFSEFRLYNRTINQLFHAQLKYDEWLSTSYWKSTFDHRLATSQTAHSAFTQRLKWVLSLHPPNTQSVYSPVYPPVYLMNTLRNGEAGMLSYPNEDPIDKLMAHINLPALVQLFETCGVDLRIIVLNRSPLVSLVSTLKRGHGKGISGEEGQLYYMSRVLSSSASVIQGQLEQLDPAFYRSINLNQFVQQPREHAQILSEFTGMNPELFYQALLRQGQKHYLQPNNNWMTRLTDMTTHPIITDHFYSTSKLPIYHGYDFSLQTANPAVGSGMCHNIHSMTLRRVPTKAFVLTSDDQSSHRFLRLLIEQISGLFTSSSLGHVDLVSWPDSVIKQPHLFKSSWSASHLVGARIRSPYSRASDDPLFDGKEPPALIVIRNPLEMVFARALPRILKLSDFNDKSFVENEMFVHSSWSAQAIYSMHTIVMEELNSAANEYMSLVVTATHYAKQIPPVPLVSYEELLADHTGSVLRRVAAALDLDVNESSLQCVMASLRRLNLPAGSLQGLSSSSSTINNYPILIQNATAIDHIILESGFSLVGTPSRPFLWSQVMTLADYDSFSARVTMYATQVGDADKWKQFDAYVRHVLSEHAKGHVI